MYERSAIVLERYFDTLLGYSSKYNLQDNFYNFCSLVEKLEKFQINYKKEVVATQEFNKCVKKVKAIQSAQEKLYQRIVKLEYNRNLLFNNVEGKIDDTRRCIEKIESDVEKCNKAMKERKEEFLEILVDYGAKRHELAKCRKYKKMAENEYIEIFEKSQSNFKGIMSDTLEIGKAFAKFDDAGQILEKLQENGKGEKIQFNEEVMKCATTFSIDISQKLLAIYLEIYDRMKDLLTDIDAGRARVDIQKKYVKNEKAKVDFIIAVKEYIFQFLDYERMTIIHGKKSHNKLMSEACEKFNADTKQIDNLYELLLKEIVNKATKKCYTQLYNKSYLLDIQRKEERFKREKNRINLNTATLLNSNYWRIEGIKNIYTVFYKTVSEVFGRDVAEFDLPKGLSKEAIEPTEVQKEDEPKKEETPKFKIPFKISEEPYIEIEDEKLENDIYEENESNEETLQDNNEGIIEKDTYKESNENSSIIETNNDYENLSDIDLDQEFTIFERNEVDEDFDIFGEKYKNIDFSKLTSSILESDKEDSIPEIEDIEMENGLFSTTKTNKISFDEDIPYEVEEEEENLLINVKSTKRRKNEEIEDIDLTSKKEENANFIKKLRKINNKKKKVENNIW